MTIKNLTVTGLASTALVVMAATPALACHTPKPTPKPVEHKIGVCHPTGQSANPYVFKMIDQDDKVAGDIVAKSAADCPKPVTTPSPSPSPSPSPTPVVTTTGQGGAGGQVLTAATTQTPVELPKTGSTAGLSTLLGLPAMAIAGRAYLRARLGR